MVKEMYRGTDDRYILPFPPAVGRSQARGSSDWLPSAAREKIFQYSNIPIFQYSNIPFPPLRPSCRFLLLATFARRLLSPAGNILP
eukprot:4198632-Pyramimonas_sp.AAC.1